MDFEQVKDQLGAFDTILAERSFRDFVSQAWGVVDPSAPFTPNWHIDAVCDHLEAVSNAQIQRLVLNVPPGTAKSLLVSVLWPCWEWIRKPQRKYLTSSHGQDLATRDARRSRGLITSDWYQARWGERFKLTSDQNEKRRYENDKSGYRVAIGVGQGLGERADRMLCDDPLKTDQSNSDPEREGANTWWRETMEMRANDRRIAAWVIVMQRLHDQDLSGHVLEMGGWEHLFLPMRYEPKRSCVTSIGFSDPRSQDRELLFPARWNESDVEQMERSLGPYATAGQLQQRPSPASGGILKREYWQFWAPVEKVGTLGPVKIQQSDGSTKDVYAVPLPRIDEQVQSWDCAFKDLSTSDYVVGQVWGKRAADRFLLHQDKARRDFPATLKAVRVMSAEFPRATLKLIEDKANGPAIISTLRHEITGIVPITPEGGKVARAISASPQIASGNVYLPHPATAPWVMDLIEEAAAFPNGAHDDAVDAMTQALKRMLAGGLVFPVHEEELLVNSMQVPGNWKRGFALVVSKQNVAAVWGATDPDTGILYLTGEYCRPNVNPAVHAADILGRGNWIPGVINSLGVARAEHDRNVHTYRANRVKLSEIEFPESGLPEVLEAMEAGKIKAFRTLQKWPEQFRMYRRDDKGKIVKQDHEVVEASALLYFSRARMTLQPAQRKTGTARASLSTGRGWMA